MNYNLLQEKWIPVLWKNGNTNRVGIIEALTQADRIRQIAANNPMDRMAILRFLLALLYWCQGNPPDGEALISGDLLPSNWFTKINDKRNNFILLGDGDRFYQCKPGLAKAKNFPPTTLCKRCPLAQTLGTSDIRQTKQMACVRLVAPWGCCACHCLLHQGDVASRPASTQNHRFMSFL